VDVSVACALYENEVSFRIELKSTSELKGQWHRVSGSKFRVEVIAEINAIEVETGRSVSAPEDASLCQQQPMHFSV
jgi:hypothetical protein